MAEKIATREAYGKALAALAEKYPDLVCFDADLAGATMTKFFKAACPERFFDMGIAEADMQGVAAGLATCGFKPFTNTFAMFAAGRSWEQVRKADVIAVGRESIHYISADVGGEEDFHVAHTVHHMATAFALAATGAGIALAGRFSILLARGYAALESRESPQGTVLALYPV